MSKRILLFEVKEECKKEIIAICQKQGIETVEIRPKDYQQSLGFLAGIKGFKAEKEIAAGAPFPAAMLVFSGFNDAALDAFVKAYNASGVPKIPLKAVLTQHNVNWTPKQLFGEILKEHQSLAILHKK